MMALEAGGVGLQIGGEATDFIFLVMNRRGAHSILSSKVKLGADAAVAAGPKGRDAQAATDVTLRAEILTYSRSRGLFAGISAATSARIRIRSKNRNSSQITSNQSTRQGRRSREGFCALLLIEFLPETVPESQLQ